MTMRNIHSILTAAMVVTLAGGSAHAASGYVSGQLMFWQAQGNYCPAGRDCTGAKYPQSVYNSAQPVCEVQVQVVDQDLQLLGASTADMNGNFIISWYRPTLPSSAKILWKARHKELRFEVVSASSGGIYYFTSNSFSLVNGSSITAPQNVGSIQWGSAASPNALANLYDGAHRTWRHAFSMSGLMLERFTDVTIRAFDGSTCPMSCASGATKTITIDSSSSAFMPQGRIMHEMGHIASYLSRPHKFTAAAGYPAQCTGCGFWNITSPEWKSLSFEEAVANFLGDVAMYSHAAREPTTCLSSSYCGLSALNLEDSSGISCATGVHRMSITAERYLWDVYDTVDDGTYSDTVNMPYWRVLTTLSHFPDGTANHQVNEPWNSLLNAVDDYDGRSAEDFQYNLVDRYAIDSSSQRANNCSP